MKREDRETVAFKRIYPRAFSPLIPEEFRKLATGVIGGWPTTVQICGAVGVVTALPLA
jgi:hypothetical protein